MILRDCYTPAAFLSAIAGTIARAKYAQIHPEDIEPGQEIVYLAGGYWRARLVWREDGPPCLIGAQLVNPDRTSAECVAVERGIAVLIGCTYQPTSPTGDCHHATTPHNQQH